MTVWIVGWVMGLTVGFIIGASIKRSDRLKPSQK